MQFALLISVLVALLLSAFLLLTHVQSFFTIKTQEVLQTSALTNQQIFKSLPERITTKDTIVTTEGDKQQKIFTNYHGAWTKVFSQIETHHQKIKKTALIGSTFDQKSPNLYLSNTNSPLVIVGDTRLEGNSYLPKQGVKAGNISGNYYQGSSLYYGRVIESEATLPKVDQQWISYLERLSNGSLLNEEHSISLKKELKHTFYKQGQNISSPSTIILGDEDIAGNITIQSAIQIIVHSTAKLEGVILIAPNIIIKDNVKGNLQAIATKKITVGKGCYLSYPSALILFDQNKIKNTTEGTTSQNKEPDFTISKNTLIEGSVVYLKKQKDTQNRIKTHLKTELGTEIIGEVYCEGNIDFQGIVRGSVYTRQFIANQSGSIYLNHVYNGKILNNPIPNYAGLPFINSKNSVAKWLY